MTSGYRLLSYRDTSGQTQAGLLAGDRVHAAAPLLDDIPNSSSVMGLLNAWDRVHPRLHAAAKNARGGQLLGEVALLAPLLYPGTLFCAGANYWDHLEEMAEIAKRTTGKAPAMTKAKDPYFFMKTTAGSIIGTGTP